MALHTLGNTLGLTAQVSEFGATLVSVRVPDRRGVIGEVTLGHDDFRGYVEQNPYLGSTVGRSSASAREPHGAIMIWRFCTDTPKTCAAPY